jgi:cytochrome P450
VGFSSDRHRTLSYISFVAFGQEEIEMSFFKNLFGKEELFVPTPTQSVPGLEPIIVQAVENVFANLNDQKEIFDLLVRNRRNTTVLIILSLLSVGPKDAKDCKEWLNDNTSAPIDPGTLSKDGTFYYLAADSGFHAMKDAERWVKSITKSQV